MLLANINLMGSATKWPRTLLLFFLLKFDVFFVVVIIWSFIKIWLNSRGSQGLLYNNSLKICIIYYFFVTIYDEIIILVCKHMLFSAKNLIE